MQEGMGDETCGCLWTERNGFGIEGVVWEEGEETGHKRRGGGTDFCIVDGIENEVGVGEIALGDSEPDGICSFESNS